MSCKTINIDLTNVPPVPIQIGVAGENSFRTITFDASKWGADYPDATYTVVYRRSDGYLYPVLVNASADAIVWNPTGTDTAVSGNGQLEVRLLDGETIGKTIIMQTYVAPSLSSDESEPSTPAPDWVNDVADDADRAEDAVSHYPQIRNDYWWVWDVQTETWVNTGVKARGEGGGGNPNAVLYTPMNLTPAQQEQARGNIGIEFMTAEDIEELWQAESVLFQDAYEHGEVTAGGNSYERFPSGPSAAQNRARAKQEYIRRVPLYATSVTVTISDGLLCNGKYKIGWAFYTANYAQIQASIKGWYTTKTTFSADVPSNAVYYMIYIATVSNSASAVVNLTEIDYESASIVFDNSDTDYAKAPWYAETETPPKAVQLTEDPFIFSVNHRGYSTDAPENTLPAFVLSRKKGFRYVECDVLFTLDEVPVILHDATINRTARNADGTELSASTPISSITFEQARQYDYGIWKGSSFAGTKIPSFAEFIQLCKQLSITPLIELKNETTCTDARVNSVAHLIEAVGMQDHVTFISFSADALSKMSVYFPNATLGLGFQGTYSAANISEITTAAASLKNGKNRVCVSLRNASMTDELFEIVEAAGLSSFVWTVNNERDCATLHRNVIGVLSDSLNAGRIIENAIINP